MAVTMSSPSELHPPEHLACGDSHPPRGVWLRRLRLPFLFSLFSLSVSCISCGGGVSDPPPPVSVTVVPGSAQTFTGDNVQFSATVQNAASTAVTWQVNQVPGGNVTVGTIDPTGLCAAPAVRPTPPTVTVTAVLQSDSTKTGSSSVTILSLSPALSSVTTSQTLQLNVLTPGAAIAL